MKILVVGRGGREHAMAWKISQSTKVSQVYVAPGSDAMAEFCKCVPINEQECEKLADFVQNEGIDLTLVGPEAALMKGIANTFHQRNLPIFAPTQEAAMIEGSKQFAKEIMMKYNVPTAQFQSFADYNAAIAYVREKGAPIVIKYDGLAAGKGVVVAMTFEEADQALKEMLVDSKFGSDKVIIEEFLQGPEFSLMALVHNDIVLPLAIAQDHKRAFDGDKGPNTGGMGAYSPVKIIPQSAIDTALETIMKPVAKALVAEGKPFTGILYGGLMLTAEGPKVIEFNARFGDPETEVVLPKMKSDLVEIILDLMAGKTTSIEWHDKFYVGVVLASKGYPENYEKGAEIKGLENCQSLVFHAGTAKKEGKWITQGGRVLMVVGEGETQAEATQNAYNAIHNIDCNNLFYRKDIGYQSL